MSTFGEKYGKKVTAGQFKRLEEGGYPTYMNLEELYTAYGPAKKYKVEAIYINDKGKYGPRPSVRIRDKAGKPVVVNFPKHKLEQTEDILEDTDAIADINAGKVGFVIYSYKGNDKVTYYSANWIDI